MPLFEMKNKTLSTVEQTNFAVEKELQTLIETNLETVFNCRFVQSEYPTGAQHAGRIDTLALSEDDNPVIIEYKKSESSELINQSLFYLHWIQDHKGDFEIAVQKTLGNGVKIDWSDVRVICIAPNYKKYDLHAVQVMGANIELWKYRLYKNNSLYLEEVFQASKASNTDTAITTETVKSKNPIMIEAGKKAAQTRATGSYTFEGHLKNKISTIQSLLHSIREYITKLDPVIEEVPKKFYIAYKLTQNIACIETASKKKITIFLKLKKDNIKKPPRFYRDVSNIGHYGTGDAEFTITTEEEFELVKPFIELAYNKIGG